MGEVSTMAALFILVSLSFASVLGESPVVDAATCTKLHEQYIDCLAGQCSPKTCDDLGRPIACPFIVGPCPGGCICEEGYLRNSEGACIKIEQCPPKPCGVNQTWVSPCNTPCNNQLCPRNDKETPPCEPVPPCYPGCQCKLNYRLNSTRHCILAPDCPPVTCTRQNEVWDSCPSACLAENCEDVNNQPKVCNTLVWLCSPRCVCKKGHFRNKDGLCVPAAQCSPKCTKPNEKYIDCLAGQCQPKTCKELQAPAPCPRVKPPCSGGCICIDGFVRDDSGACIKKENCPIICNGPNEQNSTCANKQCTPSTCKEVVKMPYCPPPNPGPCTIGCICKNGFVRNSNGTCVAIKDCPEAGNCASKNETWVQCAANCAPAYCPTNDQPQPNCFLPVGACQPGCHCKLNYRINKYNQCILASECPAVPCTRPNEIFSSCPSNRIMSCAAIGTTPVLNNGLKICNPGCICKTGFYKNDNGTCVPKSECHTDLVRNAKPPAVKPPISVPRKCPENEVLKSRTACPPDTCDSIYLSFLCVANQTETVMCTCKEGYLRTNSTGVCVPVDRCLPPECANDPNAKRGCGNRCKKTCADYNDTKKVCKNNVCKLFGCDCQDGFVYDENVQKCVKPSQCTKQCKKPHERYSACFLGECIPKTCNDLGKPIACPSIADPCAGGCICEEGYVRDCNGDCIEKIKCPSCGGDPNAQSGCGNPCGKTCDSRGVNKSELFCPQYCETNGCDCRPGFLLDTDAKKCVPEKSCPKPNQCKKPNERYSDCLLGECVPKTCDDLGKPIACPDVAGPCGGGCICTKGFVRNSNGDCIDKLTCPSCGGDPNAQSGCGNPCGKTCDSRGVNKSELICPQYCNTNGCDCRPGFLLDTDAKKCVPEKSCPKSSQCKGRNEVYSSCPAGQCGPKTCDNLINPAPCPRVIPPCPGGCICQEGYLRDSNGTCIEKNKCPKQCKKPNERYTDCLLGECVPKTCDDLGKPIACATVAAPCAGGCICAEGFVRNKNGDCIDKFKCPSCGGDPNAQSGCSNPCGKTCASRAPNVAQIACPLYCEYNGCDCKKGFLLDTDSNKCVPENSCPKPSQPQCKGPHEVYNSCPIGQCGPKTCDNLINPPPCPRIIPPCPGGCICKEGYLRDSNGICIEKNKCPQLACSSNQTYVSCSVNCPDKYCPENDQPQPVCDPPRNCPPGCTCKINYKLNKSGQCILASECPPINCTRQNEEYNSCPSDCSTDRCEDADTPPAVCNTLLLNCQPKCVCKKNHYRNQDGLCVPAKDCPSVCKDPNAEWKDCKDTCPGTCQNTRPNCVSKACVAGCQCKDGYVLSKPGGECVKIDTCADYANCGANQTFVFCTFKCPQVMCPDTDQTILCKPPRDCPGGCGCKPNYRYNADGECILSSDCPPVKCTRPNEEWSPCRSEYDWERCDDRYNSPPIVGDDDATCNPRCTCIKGYFKNNAYKCVPEKECPPI
ncbi:zonadhesin-like isoform X2 [Choristoneura fumiferana]|uniref:zonadhesin-like isoform X2 n=1 Tax=Choristoneura fumiferana TaxID=7141 RepID=UPI003D15F055